jgi:hypothetical protein
MGNGPRQSGRYGIGTRGRRPRNNQTETTAQGASASNQMGDNHSIARVEDISDHDGWADLMRAVASSKFYTFRNSRPGRKVLRTRAKVYYGIGRL